MGEMIRLSINVFKHDAERFMRLFQVLLLSKKILPQVIFFDHTVGIER